MKDSSNLRDAAAPNRHCPFQRIPNFAATVHGRLQSASVYSDKRVDRLHRPNSLAT